jgi:ADP-heptose:LPS heptosyltransferase
LGNAGPEVPGTVDLRGKTSLAQAAAVIDSSDCYVGIDSGLMWIAGSLQVPAVGLYGTSYIPAYGAIHPKNPNASYIQVEGAVDGISPEQVLAAVAARRRTALAPVGGTQGGLRR